MPAHPIVQPPMTTPKLTLISHPLCPFVQRAAIVLLEKQVPFERLNVDLSAKPDWFLALSPTGKVPVLQIHKADGLTDILFESMPICEYLEEAMPGPRLYPSDPLARARQRAWIEFGSSTLGDVWGYLNARDQATADAKAAAVTDKLAQLEKFLGHGPYFDGEAFGMVDAVFAPVFRYFDQFDRIADLGVFHRLPKVTAWRRALAKRPSVRDAVDGDYGNRLRVFLERHDAYLLRRSPHPAHTVA